MHARGDLRKSKRFGLEGTRAGVCEFAEANMTVRALNQGEAAFGRFRRTPRPGGPRTGGDRRPIEVATPKRSA